MSRPETTIFGSLSSKPASRARSLGDFSRTSNPPPSGGGEWDPSQDGSLARAICLVLVAPLKLNVYFMADLVRVLWKMLTEDRDYEIRS